MIIWADGGKLQKQFFEQRKKKKSVQNIFLITFSVIFSVSLTISFSTLNSIFFFLNLIINISCCRQNRRWQESFDWFWLNTFGRLMLQIITTQLFSGFGNGIDNWTRPDSLSYQVLCTTVHTSLHCLPNNTAKVTWISSQLTTLALSSASGPVASGQCEIGINRGISGWIMSLECCCHPKTQAGIAVLLRTQESAATSFGKKQEGRYAIIPQVPLFLLRL